ncbi:MAG: translation initiation factor IF-2 N-terminal domain-containing protein [Gloeobacteraceae cyanobacterium ES-bin-144]|nr:translation initiation factor IF-2 N-terminal domain-containing protein [Verrucomicrobiales bacterium]
MHNHANRLAQIAPIGFPSNANPYSQPLVKWPSFNSPSTARRHPAFRRPNIGHDPRRKSNLPISMSIRIHELAVKLGIPNKEIMALLRERKVIGANVTSPSSTISEVYAEDIAMEFGVSLKAVAMHPPGDDASRPSPITCAPRRKIAAPGTVIRIDQLVAEVGMTDKELMALLLERKIGIRDGKSPSGMSYISRRDGDAIAKEFNVTCCKGPCSISIDRRADTMANTVAPLLEKASHILLIDPHFDGRKRNFIRVLEAMLDRIPFAEKCKSQNGIRVEYHLAVKPLLEKAKRAMVEFDMAKFVDETQAAVNEIRPAWARVDFFVWKQQKYGEKLHDRFVLTELGGVMFSVGLDARQNSADRDDPEFDYEMDGSTVVARLGQRLYEKTWADYQGTPAAFDLVHQFSVGG